MSTCDGATLAMSAVASHNLFRNCPKFSPRVFKKDLVTMESMLLLTRLFGIPCTAIAIMIALYSQQTGYLIVVAYEIVLAGCVVPIFMAFHCKDPSPNAGLAALVGGTVLRAIQGRPANPAAPGRRVPRLRRAKGLTLPGVLRHVPAADKWSPGGDQCEQTRLRDFTDVDSTVSPFFSLLCFFVVQYGEKWTRRA